MCFVKRNPNKKGNTAQHQAPLTTVSPPLASWLPLRHASWCVPGMSSVLDVPLFLMMCILMLVWCWMCNCSSLAQTVWFCNISSTLCCGNASLHPWTASLGLTVRSWWKCSFSYWMWNRINAYSFSVLYVNHGLTYLSSHSCMHPSISRQVCLLLNFLEV